MIAVSIKCRKHQLFRQKIKYIDKLMKTISFHSSCTSIFILFFLLTPFFLSPPVTFAGGSLQRTMEAYSQIQGITTDQLKADQEQIKAFDYNNQLAIRALSSLQDITAAETPRILSFLSTEKISFDRAVLFEKFCQLDEMNLEVALKGFKKISEIDFKTLYAAEGVVQLSGLKAEQFFKEIDFISNFGGSGRWAITSLLQIEGMDAEHAVQCIAILKALDEEQRWAAEGLSKIKGLTPKEAIQNLEMVKQTFGSDALTIQALGNLPGMTGAEANLWLNTYFSKPQSKHDALYLTLSPTQKTTLLQAFYKASDILVWDINNLHSVSNGDGNEIPVAVLKSASIKRLTTLFNSLTKEIQGKYGQQFTNHTAKGNTKGAVTVLRKATAAARKYTATRCSTANIYILLSRLTIMYDSSYRLIVAPELQKRINTDYQGKLLPFLQDIDPESVFVATFATSMAQKRQLDPFWPKDGQGQRDVLEIISRSAFRDHNSLIFFATGFTRVLKVALPEASHYLLEKLISLAQTKDSLMAQQIRIILQFYLEEQSSLLDKDIQEKIREIMKNYGEVALSYYDGAPFAEWIKDGELHAFSTYNTDDDGYQSFLSNSRYLLSKGYQPILTESFNTSTGTDEKKHFSNLLEAVSSKENGSIEKLFRFMKDNPVVIDFVKTVDSMRIYQSVVVFQNATIQRNLIEHFLKAGHEMLIHRGHSYWLGAHLLVPLRELNESGKLDAFTCGAKQRFLSIGSCGATNNFTELRTLFKNNIDIIGSLGTGMTSLNNLYNVFLLESVAKGSHDMNWNEMDRRAAAIMTGQGAQDYLLPGSLPAVLYKIQGAGGQCKFR